MEIDEITYSAYTKLGFYLIYFAFVINLTRSRPGDVKNFSQIRKKAVIKSDLYLGNEPSLKILTKRWSQICSQIYDNAKNLAVWKKKQKPERGFPQIKSIDNLKLQKQMICMWIPKVRWGSVSANLFARCNMESTFRFFSLYTDNKVKFNRTNIKGKFDFTRK